MQMHLPLFIRGDPEWWCRADEGRDSGYRCFDRPGIDRTTNEELFPITPAVIADAIRNVKDAQIAQKALEEKQAADLKRQAEARAAREAEIEELKRQEDAERQEELARQDAERRKSLRINSTKKYFLDSNADPLTSGFAVSVIENKGGALGEGFASDHVRKMLEKLSEAKRFMFPFQNEFTGSSLQKMIRAGSYDDLVEADFFTLYPKILLVMISPECRKESSSIAEVVSCTTSMEAQIGGKDGVIQQRRFQVKSTAFSEEIAVRRSIEELFAGDFVKMLSLED